MIKWLLDPDAAYRATQARADRLGVTYDDLVEIDKYMANVYEAEVHFANAGFVALAVLKPALLAVACQAGLLSAWLLTSRPQFDRAVEEMAGVQSEEEYYPRALKVWTIYALMSAVAMGIDSRPHALNAHQTELRVGR